MKINVPPLKIQGIKTKLVEKIYNLSENLITNDTLWVEPFMGSGVVGLNIAPKQAIFSDTNPDIINFYKSIQNGAITSQIVFDYLQIEKLNLLKNGELYYKEVRKRFNENKSSLDFLFLNRSCFNGMMRYNKNGGFNVPYCHKDNRFSKAYITKIVNQVSWVSKLIYKNNKYHFYNQDFEKTISNLPKQNAFIYVDPPYIDRYADYYNSWGSDNEKNLYNILNKSNINFMLSTWIENKYRKNEYIEMLWNKFNIETTDHFYHLGAKETNRNKMTEGFIFNYKFTPSDFKEKLLLG